LQTEQQAEALAMFLRDRLEAPRLLYQLKHVRAVPMLELGDRVTIINTEQLSSSREGFVVGIDWQYSAEGGYYMDINILDAVNLYPTSTPFIVGTTKYGPSGGAAPVGQLVY
jgi:hypothetical protein